MIKRMGAMLSLLCVAVMTFAQMHEPIQCETSWKMVGDNVAELRIAAAIDAGWHVYSTELEDGPTAAALTVETIKGARLDGKLGFTDGKEIAKYDDMFGMDVRYFEDKVTFVQRFILEDDYLVQGYFTYGACDDESCLPPTNVEFKYEGKYTAPAAPQKKAEPVKAAPKKEEPKAVPAAPVVAPAETTEPSEPSEPEVPSEPVGPSNPEEIVPDEDWFDTQSTYIIKTAEEFAAFANAVNNGNSFADKIVAFSDFVFASRQKSSPLHQNK